MSDKRKTLDDLLYEGLLEEVDQSMEKEASQEVSSPAPEPKSESYNEMKKLAQLLRDVAHGDDAKTALEDFKDTIKSVDSE